MTKNIVVFSDGTGQEGGKGTNTNVYRLYNMVLDRSPKQIAFYDRGLGTGLRKFSGNLAGRGISQKPLMHVAPVARVGHQMLRLRLRLE